MTVQGRFSFVQIRKSGAECVRLGAALDNPLTQVSQAEMVADLGSVPGQTPPVGVVPQRYERLLASRSNQWVAAQAVELGRAFIDLNVWIYAQDGTGTTSFFNEHTFSGTHRANCTSTRFQAFLADLGALGAPQSTLAGCDYSLDLDGSSHRITDLAWTNADTLVVRLRCGVRVTKGPHATLPDEVFEFEMSPTPGSATIVSRNGGVWPSTPAPVSPMDVGPSPRLAWTGPFVTYLGAPVNFPLRRVAWVSSTLRPLLGWANSYFPRYQQARMAAGYPLPGGATAPVTSPARRPPAGPPP